MKNILFILLIVFGPGCNPFSKEPAARPPVKLAVIDDLSQSATLNKVPRLSEEMITDLVNLVQEVGGSISYLPLTEQSFVPMVRLDLEPIQKLNLREQAVLRKRQERQIQIFQEAVFTSISAERTARRTDFWGAVKRVERLYNEIAIGPAANKILLALTDAEDDAEKFEPTSLASDVTVIVVGNTDEKAVKTLSNNVIIFEGLSPALHYINHLAKGGKQ